MRRIKDAFEKPFRNNATSALAFESAKQKGKGKEKPTEENTELDGGEWDINLDLNQSPEPLPQLETGRKRPSSPVWDIELDLNDSDLEEEVVPRKKPRPE